MSEPNGRTLDLAALAERSEKSTLKGSASQAGADNPFIKYVRESYEEDEREKDTGWREVRCDVRDVPELVTTLRAVSTYFGRQKPPEPIGVHLKVEFQPDPNNERTIEVGPGRFPELPKSGDVWFKYTGRARLNRGSGRRQASSTAPTSAVETPTDEETELADSA